jgi:hypothetical protein
MSLIFTLNGLSLPHLIRTKLANHLQRLARVEDLRALELARYRAEGFVEGVEASCVLTPATIEALFIAVEEAALARRPELTP